MIQERLSIFDIYKIGVGPSSSHTLGPWKAAQAFIQELKGKYVASVNIQLFGSLSKTGVGHCTDIAILLGLQGHDPKTIPTDKIPEFIQAIHDHQCLYINEQEVPFDSGSDIVFRQYSLPYHPNTLTLRATLGDGALVEETYYSVGGGFIHKEGETDQGQKSVELPYPIDTGKDLLAHTNENAMSIAEVVFQNELRFRDAETVRKDALEIFQTMLACVFKGCQQDGVLPGGLNVQRRAKKLNEHLLEGQQFEEPSDWIEAIRKTGRDFSNINKWVSCFALAVNEENAALGRIVTSPTNGAAGVIPAVLLYYYCFCGYKGEDDIINFLLTSGEIGCIFKKGATISAAEGGCQAEIGVSSAMAAGGLTALMGGTPKQVLMASEIAMEHHLGLTCDPVGGLVQIPCIERNAMGAMKAITASHLALTGNPETTKVHIDAVIKTMWETARDMHHNYKETSEGGLAINIPVALPEC